MAINILPRNPYTVGGPVRGPHFYGRTALIQSILNGNDRAIWVVGNRRIGKTSLLRRMEQLSSYDGRVAFLISMEAADTVDDLAQCFLDDMETSDDRLARLGLTIADLQNNTPQAMMRLLDQGGRERGIEVLLLLDEAEALIGIAEREGDDILKDLRREMQRSDALRVVMTATKRLAALNDLCSGWDTSPFLYGVSPRYLGRLEHGEALALVRQSQSSAPPSVPAGVAEAVLAATDGHPFLTQWLCDRLWIDGALRAPTADDLIPDANLVNLFQLDYNYLAPVERRILRCLSFVESLDEAGLMGQLGVSMAGMQLRYLMQSLVQLCYVRRAGERYRTGNALLHIWLQFWATDTPASPMSDAAAVDQADEEQQQIMALATVHKRRLRVLEEQRALQGVNISPETLLEIDNVSKQINKLNDALLRIQGNR